MKATISKKIKGARILRSLSQEKLANKVGVTKQMISKYECGLSTPSSKVLIKMANSLDLSLDYFFTSPSVDLHHVNFRKKSKLSRTREKAIKEELKLKLSNYLELENILEIDNVFDLKKHRKQISNIAEVQSAVHDLRDLWDIGHDPIHNITQILEDEKIKVIEVKEKGNLFDGMASLIDSKYAVIVVNENFPVERKRFTLLHELAHIILDLPECTPKEEERYCNKFAGEFLLPKKAIMKELGSSRNKISFQELESIQKKYGISIEAIVYRLLDTGLITKSQQGSFYKKLNVDAELKELVSKSRFKTPEVSNRYKQLVYRAYSQELISSSKAANLLNTKLEQILDKELV